MTEPTPVMRRGLRALAALIALLLTLVICAPIALSSQDLVRWATSPTGLALSLAWGLFVFVALDAAAATCVLMVFYSAWRGETGGTFALLVWVFAFGSAYANLRYASRTPASDDDWFFPAMSLLGPALLEVTVRRIRRWVKMSAGRYERPLPHFRLIRWFVAGPETWTAWRLAVTEGYSRPEHAIDAARAARVGDVVRSRSGVDDAYRDAPTAVVEIEPVATARAIEPEPTSTITDDVSDVDDRGDPPPASGRRASSAKLPDERVAKLLADIRAGGKPVNVIADEHGVTSRTVYRYAQADRNGAVSVAIPPTNDS